MYQRGPQIRPITTVPFPFRRIPLLAVTAALAASGTGCLADAGGADPETASVSSAVVTENAAAFSWTGAVDTDQPLSVLAGNFTLSAQVLIQHAHAQPAPIFSAQTSSGGFSLFYDYFNNNPSRVAKLVLQFGGATATYAATGLATIDGAGIPLFQAWHEVVLVRQGSRVSLYMDGAHQVATAGNIDANGDLVVPAVPSLPPASDLLRLGRNAAADLVSQFYGFIDEVAVFNRALAASEISSKLNGQKLAGNESGLIGYYSFDTGAPAPAAAHHTPVLRGKTTRTAVLHLGPFDMLFLPTPANTTTMKLPFRVGVPFVVLWGNEINSHVGGAAFCWDFVAIGPGWTQAQIQSNTNGQSLFTSAAGTVTFACDQGDDACNNGQLATKGPLTDGYNEIDIQHTPTEISTFLHIKTNSVTEAFKAHGLPSPSTPGNTPMAVANQQWVARIGTRSAPGAATNYHLHYAFGTPDVTVPMAFSNYEASDDQGASWHAVARGVPAQGQWVRNTH